MTRSILIVIGLFLIFSCHREENPKTHFADKHPNGEVIPRVICTNAPSYSYSLYLPKAYDPGKPMPVVYSFDPDGNGRLPVNLMKDAAEKLGFILVGSNNSRNGIDQSEMRKIIRLLLDNTNQYIAIDIKQMYAAGFSGGARVACSMALSNPDIQGVIACSAGFRPGPQVPDFVYIGIAGLHDMNYLEVVRLTKYLQSNGGKEQLIVYRGKHSWPPKKILDEALEMLEVYAMRNADTPVDKGFLDSMKENYVKQITDLMNAKSTEKKAKAYEKTEEAITLLEGLTGINQLNEIRGELQKNPSVHLWLERQDSLEIIEAEKQRELAEAFRNKSAAWWDRELTNLNREAADTTQSLISEMAIRLLGYISLNCYGFVKHALDQQNLDALRFLNNIYLRSDPENYFAWYAQAWIDLQEGKIDKAIGDLKKSIDCGYPDKMKLKNDPLIAQLKDQPAFIDLFE